jgi:hypothetical protein
LCCIVEAGGGTGSETSPLVLAHRHGVALLTLVIYCPASLALCAVHAPQIEAFFDVHDACGSMPGGVHVEMTGDNVTECIGGGASISVIEGGRWGRAGQRRAGQVEGLRMEVACLRQLLFV